MPLDADLPKLEGIADVYSNNNLNRPAYVQTISKEEMEKNSLTSKLKKIGATFGKTIDDALFGNAYGEESDGGNVDYEALGNWAEKIDAYKNADIVIAKLKQYKDDKENKSSEFFNNLGVANYSIKNTDEAIKLYNKGLEFHPDSPNILYNLGAAFFDKKEYEKSYEFFKKSNEIKPNQKDTLNWIDYVSKRL